MISIPQSCGGGMCLSDEEFLDMAHRMTYAEEQVEAVRALASKERLTGMDIVNALDVEHW